MKKISLLVLALASLSNSAITKAVTFTEDFSASPLQTGWRIFGDTNLFRWNPANQNLEVTWDSSRTNSYFYQPLGTIVSRDDDFSFGFDLLLKDVAPADAYLWSFQIAAGLLNIDQAAQPSFLRGSGFDSPNLVEFDYFRADEFGTPATIYPTFISTNAQFNYNPGGVNSTNHALLSNVWHRISLNYAASNRTSFLVVSNLDDHSAVELAVPLNETFTDFRVGSFSINNYNDAGQFPGFEGSMLAHGVIDNIHISAPPAPIQQLAAGHTNGVGWVSFLGRAHFLYTLERMTNFTSWFPASAPVLGNGEMISLQDDTLNANDGFYRVRAERP